ALAAAVVGRLAAPALRGAAPVLDRTLDLGDRVLTSAWRAITLGRGGPVAVDAFAGGFVSYVFAFAAVSAMLVQMVRTAREPRLARGYRGVALALSAAILLPLAPGLPGRFDERSLVVIAASS